MNATTLDAAYEISQAALVDLDASFLFHLVLFIFTIVVLNSVVFKPMLRVEQMRHDKTRGAIEQADRVQIEARKRVAEYESAVETTRKRGNADFASIRDQAQKNAGQAVDTARQTADAKLAQATAALQERYGIARKEIQTKARDLSERIAEKVLGASK